MKLKNFLLTMLVAVSVFLFSATVMAEPINWTTQQYRAYANAGDYDYGYDTQEKLGLPLPLEVKALGGRDCILGAYPSYCIAASSTVSDSNISLSAAIGVDVQDYGKSGIVATAEGSFSGTYTADMSFFNFSYNLGIGDSITVSITDLTNSAILYNGTLSAGSSSLTDALYVNTPVGHSIGVSFSASCRYKSSRDGNGINCSSTISYSMASSALGAFTPVSGTWQFEGVEYSGSGSGTNIALHSSATTDNMVIESDVFMNPDGASRNGFIIFDYKSPTDFKYAQAWDSANRWAIGYYNGTWKALSTIVDPVDTSRWYRMRVEIIGNTAKLYVDDDRDGSGFVYKTEATFSDIGIGSTGLATVNSHTHFDNFSIYLDSDGDGYASDVDCNDYDPAIKPGSTEVCDGIDNNCNGQIDEGLTFNTYYRDVDGDGYGDPAFSVSACMLPIGWQANNTDCADYNSTINPGATEVCDGVDNNCNGQVNEGLPVSTYYRDADNDGYGNPAISISTCQQTGYVTDNTDCNDSDSTVSPAKTEILGNCKEDDCNAATPDSTTINGWQMECLDGAGDVGQYSSVATDSFGRAHISYYDSTNGDLKYATNAPGIWVISTVDSTGNTGKDSSIAVDSNNTVHISYYDYSNFDLKYATNVSGIWVTFTLDSTGAVGGSSSLSVASNNKVHISYYNASSGDLKYATNASGAWVTSTVDSAGNVGGYTSIAVDSNNKVHISYYDYSNFDLKYATNASGAWVISTVDSTGNVGADTSIAIDSNNNIHISYLDGTNYDLKYASNASGAWITSTIDSAGMVGRYNSIAVDFLDKVHISYYDYSNHDLKYATNASGAWVISTVDSTGEVGEYSSITIDLNSRVHISYYDYTNGNLKYATKSIAWTPVSGTWQSEDSEYSGSGSGTNILLRGSATKDNVVIESDVFMNPDGASKNGFIIFDYKSPTDFKYAQAWDSANRWAIGYYNGTWKALSAKVEPVDTSRWYRMRVEIAGNTAKLYVDDDRDGSGFVYKTEAAFTDIGTGSIGLATVNSHTHFDDFRTYLDKDGDGYTSDKDCDDTTPAVNPGVVEVCDNIDNNCNGQIDEDLIYNTYFSDADGDSYGNPAISVSACTKPAGYVTDNTDCNDSDTTVSPGINEIPGNCKDDDCNAATPDTGGSGGWNIECVDSDAGSYSSVADDSMGNIHISYYDSTGGDLKYATNASGVWVTSTIDSIGDVGRNSSIAIDSNNKAHISYSDASYGDLKYATNASGSWVTSTIDSTGWVGKHPSIATDSNDNVHISHQDDDSGDLKYTTNVSGTWVTSTIDATGWVGKYSSIATDLNNNAHISYYDDTNGNLKYATNASGAWEVSIIDSIGFLGVGGSSVEIDSSNKAHISYLDYDNGDLRYATNASGSWVISTIDSAGVVGYTSSIEIDSSDNAHISYLDYTNGDLKYATNTSGVWVASTIDSDGVVGYYTSITIDSSDNAHISYYDFTNGNLKYAAKKRTCSDGDILCVPSEYSTIQSAVNAAQAGDVIRIAQGDYYENVKATKGGKLKIEGGWDFSTNTRNDDPSLTVIDGNQTGRVFYIDPADSDLDLIIKDVTVQNGRTNRNDGTPGYNIGSGVYAVNFSPYKINLNLTNNIIQNNQALGDYGDGAIAIASKAEDVSVTLTGNKIFSNHADSDSGAALFINLGSKLLNVSMNNNHVHDNTAAFASGILFSSSGTDSGIVANLSNNNISNNSVATCLSSYDGGPSYGGGIGIIASKNNTADITLTGNTISGNKAAAGAGIYIGVEHRNACGTQCNAKVTLNSSNNTISNNDMAESCTSYTNVANGGGVTINVDADVVPVSQFTFTGDTITGNALYDLILETGNRDKELISIDSSDISSTRRYDGRVYDPVLCPNGTGNRRPCILTDLGGLF